MHFGALIWHVAMIAQHLRFRLVYISPVYNGVQLRYGDFFTCHQNLSKSRILFLVLISSDTIGLNGLWLIFNNNMKVHETLGLYCFFFKFKLVTLAVSLLLYPLSVSRHNFLHSPQHIYIYMCSIRPSSQVGIGPNVFLDFSSEKGLSF